MAKKKSSYSKWYKHYRNLGYSPDRARRNAKSLSGCYVATSVYGSYDCPEVWTLRRFRDYQLSSSWYGRLFIKCYYAISPTVVKLFGKTRWFNMLFKSILDRFVNKLKSQGVNDAPYNDKEW